MNQGKTHVWNRCGERPLDCEHLSHKVDGTPNGVWRGDPGLPSHKQGVTILGTPSGRAEFVEGHLAEKIEEHGILLDRISKVTDLQSVALAVVLHSVQGKLRSPCGPSSEQARVSVNALRICCTFPSKMLCGRWPACRLDQED